MVVPQQVWYITPTLTFMRKPEDDLPDNPVQWILAIQWFRLAITMNKLENNKNESAD
jgi:hypothetical protein